VLGKAPQVIGDVRDRLLQAGSLQTAWLAVNRSIPQAQKDPFGWAMSHASAVDAARLNEWGTRWIGWRRHRH
jgi:hypothetical protein